MEKTFLEIKNRWKSKFAKDLGTIDEAIGSIEDMLNNANTKELKGNIRFIKGIKKDLILLQEINEAKQIKINLGKKSISLVRNKENDFLEFRGYSYPYHRDLSQVLALCKKSIKLRKKILFSNSWEQSIL